MVLDEVGLLYRHDVFASPLYQDFNKGKRVCRQAVYSLAPQRVITSCCVWAMSVKYSDQFGQYHAFVPSRLGLDRHSGL